MEVKYNYDSTPINSIIIDGKNDYYIKRDDLIPFSFGGNKVRICYEFIKDAIENNYDCILAYGNTKSNLCRIMANLCAKYNLECYIISSHDDNEYVVQTNNSLLVESSVKEVFECRKSEVKETIDTVMTKLLNDGKKPYYIYDHAHEKCAFNAYINAYKEIKKYELENNIFFDYIFFASGTAMTQTGLVLGQLLNKDFKRNIIGISNARTRERGKKILDDNLLEYIKSSNIGVNLESINYDFLDDYVLGGYGNYNEKIINVIKDQYYKNGINLDTTYTGKAFYGMCDYIKKNKIKNKKILFIHTGGTPLFFDNIDIFKK